MEKTVINRKNRIDTQNRNRVWILCFLFLFLLSIWSCNKEDKDYLESLKSIETTEYDGQEISKEKINELKKDIQIYKDEVEQKIKASENLGTYYKMLALEYMNLEMYGMALDSLKAAIAVYPANRFLFYYAGICSSQMAQSVSNNVERMTFLKDAEVYYLRAIKLKNTYVNALYGLSILYIFELDMPLKAESLLTQILKKEKSNIEAMFLLARVWLYKGDIDAAIDMYSAIINTTDDETLQQKAMENRNRLIEGDYET